MAKSNTAEPPIFFHSDGSLTVDIGGEKITVPRPTVGTWRDVGVLKDQADEWLKRIDSEAREASGYTVELERRALIDNDQSVLGEVAEKIVEYRTKFDRALFTQENPYPAIMAKITGRPVDSMPAWTINPQVYEAILNHWINVPLNPSNPAR